MLQLPSQQGGKLWLPPRQIIKPTRRPHHKRSKLAMPSWYIAGNERFRVPVIVFQGAGDTISGAVGWWGLRAYTNASIGSNVIKLRESGGNTTKVFTSIAGGQLDLNAISNFKGANSLFVDTLYDQSGNGIDLAQATQANQPAFNLNEFGSLPGIVFTSANSTQLLSASNIATTNQPFMWAAVVKKVNTASGQVSCAMLNSCQYEQRWIHARVLRNKRGGPRAAKIQFGLVSR